MCFPTVVCATGLSPIRLIDLISILQITILNIHLYLCSIYLHTFSLSHPPPTFKDSINDRLHGRNVSRLAIISCKRAADYNCRHSSPFALFYVCYNNNNIIIIYYVYKSWLISVSKLQMLASWDFSNCVHLLTCVEKIPYLCTPTNI